MYIFLLILKNSEFFSKYCILVCICMRNTWKYIYLKRIIVTYDNTIMKCDFFVFDSHIRHRWRFTNGAVYKAYTKEIDTLLPTTFFTVFVNVSVDTTIRSELNGENSKSCRIYVCWRNKVYIWMAKIQLYKWKKNIVT